MKQTQPSSPIALILIGVSGCGKTSVGNQLSKVINWPFYDGDDFHPSENIAKMSQGIPLNDDDRHPWLVSLHNLIAEHLGSGRSLILACSALKTKYRCILASGNPGTIFVYLKGNFDLIIGRIQARAIHYMKAEMLRSQFEVLEEPVGAVVIDITQNLDSITQEIITQLNLD
jgi:gluconokinase